MRAGKIFFKKLILARAQVRVGRGIYSDRPGVIPEVHNCK
jgi:hypothetical protein